MAPQPHVQPQAFMPNQGRKPKVVEMALANSSKDFLHWNGEYLTWKDFLSHWDMYYTSIAHTLMVEAKEDAVLFAHFKGVSINRKWLIA